MEYRLYSENPHTHLVKIEMVIEDIKSPVIDLQLPAWRPGRYEMSNYSKNLMRVDAFTKTGLPLECKKISKDRWQVDMMGEDKVTVAYCYYAAQMDAGGSYVDDQIFYINFINCLLFVPGQEEFPCTVRLILPANFKVACGLPILNNEIFAPSYRRLIDSPLLASGTMKHLRFNIEGIDFHLWLNGKVEGVLNKVTGYFERFTKEQLSLFGTFPEKDYHFIFQILSYRFHHGVEHANSTVITLGPATKFWEPEYFHNFLSVSSHELFHTWNICKIRPSEMLPYNLIKENYFNTGYVAEGFTTYYGDLMLVRSGVFSVPVYFEEVNLTLKRHFENFGRKNLSIAESSVDLWVDGYVSGTPNRKVSIYVKGALVAMMLDLEIRKRTSGKKSLDDVLKVLWEEFGIKQKGYYSEDIMSICDSITESDFSPFFDSYIYGIEDETERLNDLLKWVGCELSISINHIKHERIFGFRVLQKDGKYFADLIEPGSLAHQFMGQGDEIKSINGVEFSCSMALDGLEAPYKFHIQTPLGNEKITSVQSANENYLNRFTISKVKEPLREQKNEFKNWLKQEWDSI